MANYTELEMFEYPTLVTRRNLNFHFWNRLEPLKKVKLLSKVEKLQRTTLDNDLE